MNLRKGEKLPLVIQHGPDSKVEERLSMELFRITADHIPGNGTNNLLRKRFSDINAQVVPHPCYSRKAGEVYWQLSINFEGAAKL